MTIRDHRRKAASLLKFALLVTLLAITTISISCHIRARRMDAWLGKPIESFIVHWGAPSGFTKLKDGRIVYTWIPVHKLGRNYRTTFTASKDGIIEDWSYHDATIPGYPE